MKRAKASTAATQPKQQMSLSKHIVGLDGLRLLTAAIVLCFHLLFAIWLPGENRRVALTTLFQPLQSYFSFGWVGVEIFFVISGFVIAFSAHGTTAGTFLRHRWLRLFPAALLCATLSAAAMLYLAEIPRKSIAFAWSRSILFTPNGTWVDNAYWTLSIEIAFYGVIFLLLLLRRESWLPAIMASLGAISTIYWLMMLLEGHFQGAPRIFHLLAAVFRRVASHNVSLIAEGSHFALGVFLWLLMCHRVTIFRIVVAILCVGCGVLQIVQRTAVMQKALGTPLQRVPPVCLWACAIAVIMFSVLKNHWIQQVLGRHGVAVFRKLGLMTYPLYLLNQTMGRAVVAAFYMRLGYVASVVLAILLVVSFTYVIATYLEPPLRKWLAAQLDSIRI